MVRPMALNDGPRVALSGNNSEQVNHNNYRCFRVSRLYYLVLVKRW